MRRLVFLFACLAAPLPAQEPAAGQDSTLVIARRLATEGQGDSARALVRAKLRRTSPRDSLFPLVLFTAGSIADDLDSARTYFRRVSIEYPGSPWADDALLRLAQLAFAANDFSGAARTARRIVLDFPLSDVRLDAAYWAARAELEMGELGAACDRLATIAADTTADVELLNRVYYYQQRCTRAARADAATDTAAAAPADTAPAAAAGFSVQVAAVGSVAAADQLMRTLHDAGYQSRIVRDTTDGLWKVRVGRFAERRAAERLAVELRQTLDLRPFVVEER